MTVDLALPIVARGVRHVYLRESLSWELAGASGERIDRAIGPHIAEDLEGLAGIVRNIAPHVAKAAPGVLQGAATGFMLGGPAGALAGGIGGGLASSGATAGSGQPVPSGAAPAGASKSAAPIANPAALQLLLTLLRPEVVEALIAMVLGRNGSRGVEIAGRAVPVAAVSNLIQSLAEAASTTHHALDGRVGFPRYLADARSRGEDVGSPEVRVTALLELIHDAWDDDAAEPDQLDQLDQLEQLEQLDAEDLYPGELSS